METSSNEWKILEWDENPPNKHMIQFLCYCFLSCFTENLLLNDRLIDIFWRNPGESSWVGETPAKCSKSSDLAKANYCSEFVGACLFQTLREMHITISREEGKIEFRLWPFSRLSKFSGSIDLPTRRDTCSFSALNQVYCRSLSVFDRQNQLCWL